MCGATPLARGRWRHIALIAETGADARDVMVGDGKAVSDPRAGSGLLQVHPKHFGRPMSPPSGGLTWPNGAVASIYNGTEPDQLRGPQHDAAWCDELAKWQYAQEAWDQLQFGLRTGKNPTGVHHYDAAPHRSAQANHRRPRHGRDERLDLRQSWQSVAEVSCGRQRKYEGTRLGDRS